METLNHVPAQVAHQPTLFSARRTMHDGTPSLRGAIKRSLIAAGLAAAVAVPAWSAQLPVLAAHQNAAQSADPEAAARAEWKAIMKQSAPRAGRGCFHAAYPSLVVEQVECRGKPDARPLRTHRKADSGRADSAEVVGNGNDYVAYSQSLITQAYGAINETGVTSEWGDGGISGPNEYTLQLNTNFSGTTPACNGNSGCTVWQQFVYATDYYGPGTAAVFMEYWLINYGYSGCPSGWNSYGPDCWQNSLLEPAPDLPITALNTMELTATATAGGSDWVELYYGSEYWWVYEPDSVVDISSVWNEVEYNVVGDADGSEALFNSGSTLDVAILLQDGSFDAPLCLPYSGTTGETNNLNLGACSAFSFGPGYGYVGFTESD